MCHLDKMKGMQVGETYTNRMQTKNFTKFIAGAEREKLAAELADEHFLAVLSDGSTEEEIIYVRYATRGHVVVCFPALESVSKLDAENITAAIRQALDSNIGNEWNRKLVAIASGGAAVMTGSKNDVIRLKENIPYVCPSGR